MKAVIILVAIVVGCAVVGGLVAGFVYGIVKRGRERDEALTTLKHINQQCNLWYEDQSPALTGVRQELDKFYN